MKLLGIFIFFCIALAVDGQRSKRLAPSSKRAALGEFPFLVSIQIKGIHSCGGSLVTKSHVVTAAHCVEDFVASKNFIAVMQMTVEVGMTVIGQGKSHLIKRIAHPSNYIPAKNLMGITVAHDIAVITLLTPVIESPFVGTIELLSGVNQIPRGSVITVAGYGSQYNGGYTSMTLQMTNLVVVSDAECYYYYLISRGRVTLETHICATWYPGYGTCKGDSGGPIIYNGKLLALVSGGEKRCGVGSPEIYTQVPYYLPFINRAIQGSQGCNDIREVEIPYITT